MSLSGDIYPEHTNSNVCLRRVIHQTSPLIERRNIRRLPRPVTTPVEIKNFSTTKLHSFDSPKGNIYIPPNFEHRNSTDCSNPIEQRSNNSPAEMCNGIKCLDTQSLTNSPTTSRRHARPPILHRYNSLSPTLCRKVIGEKLSPSSLRKSVILRSSRKSEPIYVDMCNACGFPIKAENQISVATRGGTRKQFHTECFKCSM